MGKKFLKSRTVWVNLVAILAGWITAKYGVQLSAEDNIALLGVVNIVLRVITKEPITWSK